MHVIQVKSWLIFSLFVSFFMHQGWSQEFDFQFETEWVEKDDRCVPCEYNGTTGEVYSTITKSIPLRGKFDYSYEIVEIKRKKISIPSYYDESILPETVNEQIAFTTARDENLINITFHPLVKSASGVDLIEKIKVKVIVSPKSDDAFDREVEFASVSVLASGDWYKVGVSGDGMYRLDYNTLSELGVSVSGLNPNHINVYGNHIPEIPTGNWEYRPDDLMKNAIYVEGDADGSFDSGDYVLFYAKGPDNVIVNADGIEMRKNKIDSLAYYFVHIDAADAPKRITLQGNSAAAVTNTVTQFDAATFYETNQTNLLKSGDGWIGEHFDGTFPDRSLTFSLSDLVTTEPIELKTQYASASKSGTSGLKISVNGSEIDDIPASTLSGGYTMATVQTSTVTFSSGSSTLNMELSFYRTSPSAEAWLDYLQLNYKKNMVMGSSELFIRDLNSVGVGNVASYLLGGANGATRVWEITDPYNASRMNGTLSGSTLNFIANADSLRTFIAFEASQAKTPVITGTYLGKIANQNLHGLSQADYLIVAHESLRAQADRLADLHRNNGLTVHVVDIQKVYNEFGGGAADPVAIRWMAKMFYERAAVDPGNALKYLCLFGDGTYDPLNRIPNNNYLISTYNSPEAGPIDFIASFTADDFFGLLDDDEAMFPTDGLDIGVGRIPVSDVQTAEQVLNKIEHYMNYGSTLFSNATGVQCDENGYASTFGDWRSRVVLMADDENSGQFVLDCEALSDTTELKYPEMNVVKIYLDAYKQVVTSGGQRYPDVEEAINQNMNKGALVFNYVGHGGETGLALERVVSIPMIQEWANINNLPIFISATCEFSRFDDPGRISAGETTLTTPLGGAVGLLTTTRLVYITVNTILVKNLYRVIFAEENGEPLALGEIIRRTKNMTLGSNNMRNFALLGDPALKLGKASPRIMTDSINGVSVTMATDTLKALSRVTVEGHVENGSGVLLSGYNGVVYPTVFDKSKTRFTLGQDVASPVRPFDTQTNVIYKGKSTVKNGKFSFSFVVPKDIDYAFGKGKISYYGNTETEQNYGYDTSVVVGGVDPNGVSDETGPEIELFMNDENFVNGGLTDSKPLFMANIRDENGINTTGNGIGHNITLIIDGNTAAPIILNNFYEADLDTYQSGKVSYRMSELSEGPHELTFKVWDVNNNSSEETLEFTVVNEEELGISHLLNYPNPFTTRTEFYFEHNQVCNSLDVRLEIFTVSGRLVKTIVETVHSAGFRSEGIQWDGRDDFGDRLGRGVYVYRLSIETEQGAKAEKIEKLVIL